MSVLQPPVLPPPLPPSPTTDVRRLIDESRPRPAFRHAGRLIAVATIALFLAVLLPLDLKTKIVVQLMSWLTVIAGINYLWWLARAHREENRQLDLIEDLISLKRAPEAMPHIEWVMSRPMRSGQNRLRAMMLLAAAMGRQQRYDDVLIIDNELLDAERLGGPAAVVVKLGRALAMLHADHLYDADRAINDLRRLVDRGSVEVDPLTSAALRLVEIYRDIKTGHDTEAIEHFREHRGRIAQGLGHRAGEAHALAAVAFHRQQMTADAANEVAAATTLQPVADLVKTYPEFLALLTHYPPAPAPARN